MVSTASMESLTQTSLTWLDQHCSLPALRPSRWPCSCPERPTEAGLSGWHGPMEKQRGKGGGWGCTTFLPHGREAPVGCPGAACLVLFRAAFTPTSQLSWLLLTFPRARVLAQRGSAFPKPRRVGFPSPILLGAMAGSCHAIPGAMAELERGWEVLSPLGWVNLGPFQSPRHLTCPTSPRSRPELPPSVEHFHLHPE